MYLEEKIGKWRWKVKRILVSCGTRDQEGHKGWEISACSLHSWRHPGLILLEEERGQAFKKTGKFGSGGSIMNKTSFLEPPMTFVFSKADPAAPSAVWKQRHSYFQVAWAGWHSSATWRTKSSNAGSSPVLDIMFQLTKISLTLLAISKELGGLNTQLSGQLVKHNIAWLLDLSELEWICQTGKSRNETERVFQKPSGYNLPMPCTSSLISGLLAEEFMSVSTFPGVRAESCITCSTTSACVN